MSNKPHRICISCSERNIVGEVAVMGHLKCHGLVHTIEEGDSLYKIGKRYGVRVSELLFANPYLDLYNLQIGDEICVPVSDSAVFLKKSKTDDPD